jgi:hypothetical protein
MHNYTRQQIVATAFTKCKAAKGGTEGMHATGAYTLPSKSMDSMCPICKNENTDVIRDCTALQNIAEVFEGSVFKAYDCWCCGYKWSVHE